MAKKRILFLLRKYDFLNRRRRTDWVNDCSKNYDIDFWGHLISETSIQNLRNKIDGFKPDYIYLTRRKRYKAYDGRLKERVYWLPDLSLITNVPKIFVEVDTWMYPSSDPWYTQFDQLYRRQYDWGDWEGIPLFKWSVPEASFLHTKSKRNGIYFVGIASHITRINDKNVDIYKDRQEINSRFKKIKFVKAFYQKYWSVLQNASALICPTESARGDFVPEKLFEYLASGAAVITNCDLVKYGVPELKKYTIKYRDLDDLEQKLAHIKLSCYHNKALKAMKNHTHSVRYKELFG